MARPRLALLALLAGPGCACEADAPPVELSAWSGWNDRWANLSHRVSFVRAELAEDGGARLGLVGGDWSGDGLDSAEYRLRLWRATATGLVVRTGAAELVDGPEGAAVATVEVEDAELAAMPRRVALLRGFAIDTDVPQDAGYPDDYDPAQGYVSRGFAFAVGEPEVEGDTVRFTATADLRWGTSSPTDPTDRSAMDAAVPLARAGATVAWTLIGFDGTLAAGHAEGSADLPHDPPYSEQLPLEGEALPASWDADLEGVAGLPGIRAFDLSLVADGDPDEGEYLRSHGVELVPDAEAAPPVRPRAELTNSSLVETAAIAISVEADLAWLAPDGLVDASPFRFEGEHAVGEASLPADAAVPDGPETGDTGG